MLKDVVQISTDKQARTKDKKSPPRRVGVKQGVCRVRLLHVGF